MNEQLELGDRPHRNQQLFSDYYLDNLLPELPAWQALIDEASACFNQIQPYYQHYTPSNNEAQLEHDLIRPILELLGHHFGVQLGLKTPDGTKRPDYILFNNQQQSLDLRQKTLTDALLQGQAIAVADAKAWDRSLDQQLTKDHQLANKNDLFSNKNPSYQIHFYLQHSGLSWGILTNGRLWRLYHRDSAHKLDRYYEVDLPSLIAANKPHDFLYFYAFFRRASFDSHQLINLEIILQASRDYAQQVGDSIKAQVYDALRFVAQGFIDASPKLLHQPTMLREVYDHSLIVLYRLLFIFYAEARGFLPLYSNSLYQKQYSLTAIKRDVAQQLDAKLNAVKSSTILWSKLNNLFSFIDRGEVELGIAAFNGGLFNQAHYPFLNNYAIGDQHLRQAIDLLARVEGHFVDYRDLAERHLGTIYEGLLEYQLELLEQPQAGFAIGLNQQGERKETGSYYTPDYIVRYMLDQTIRPAALAAIQHQTSDQAKINAILSLNLLDPAMGSGHFLVAATEYLAQLLVDLAVQPDEATSEADIAFWRRKVAQSCIYGVDLNPLAVELAKLSLWLITVAHDRPLSFLDHHLRVGNALVGAKLGKLNPHLLRTATADPNQVSMLDDAEMQRSLAIAVDSMFLIEDNAALSLADVQEQARIYAELRQVLSDKFGRLANISTAHYFGLKIDSQLWDAVADFTLGRRESLPKPLPELVEQAQVLAAERHFFHWELEFPEIFFDRHGQPLAERAGFDVVIGNPPYIRVAQLGAMKNPFISSFYDVYESNADIYVYFFEKAFLNIKKEGLFSFISSNKFMRAKYGNGLRKMLMDSTEIIKIVDFGELNVFPEAGTFPAIYVLKKKEISKQKAKYLQIKSLNSIKIGDSFPENYLDITNRGLGYKEWILAPDVICDILDKIKNSSILLSEYIGDNIYYGIKTGYNDAFIVDKRFYDSIKENVIYADLVKEMIFGDDLRFYRTEYKDKYLIVIPSGWTSEKSNTSSEKLAWKWMLSEYPTIANHLLKFKDRLMKRSDQGEFWWELRPCDYYSVFDNSKIIYPDIAMSPRFTLDTKGYYPINTIYVIAKEDYFLLSILNSKISFFVMKHLSNVLGDPDVRGRLRFFEQSIRQLPIRRIRFTTPEIEREQVVEQFLAAYRQANYQQALALAQACLPSDQSAERSDVVHDCLAALAKTMLDLQQQRLDRLEHMVLDLEGLLSQAQLTKLNRLWSRPKQPSAEAQQILGSLADTQLDLRQDFARINEQQWKWLLKQRLKTVPNLGGLVGIWRTHQPRLAQLDQTIKATDQLIDQIVYALYGLTEAEMALIESENNPAQPNS